MSLLIKALEQAAKDRKAGRAAADADAAAEPAPTVAAASMEPSLEAPPPRRTVVRGDDPAPAPRAPSTLALDAGASAGGGAAGAAASAAPAPRRAPSTLASLAASDAQQRAHAATVMQATGRSKHVIAWLRANPVMMLGAAAVVFGLAFGIYVYLQIAYPGGFFRQAASPPPPAATAPPAAAQAPISGMPDLPAPQASAPPVSDAVLAPPGTQPVGPAAASGSIAPAVAPPAPAPAPAAAAPAPSTALSSASLIGSAPPAAEPRMSAEPLVVTRSERPTERTESPRVSRARPSAPAAATGSAPGREVVAVAPTAAQPRINPTLAQAYTLLQAGNLDESRALYGRLVQAEPLNVDALLGLAYIATQENRSEDAMKLYLRILQINPRHAVAQAALIGIVGKADPTASESRLKLLIAREPSPFLHFILGNVYADQSQWAQAQQSYFQAHHLEPGNPDYAYNLAVGLDHLRQSKLALNFYRRAEELASAQGRSNFNVSHARERIRALSSQLE